MGFETKHYALSDIIEIIGGGTPKRSVEEYWNGDIPWLSVVDFNSGSRFVDDTTEKITELGLQKSSTKLLEKGQLIISARGTVGCLAQLRKPMAFNQSCYGLSGIEGLVENDFLYYLVKQKVDNLKQITHGAVFDTITRDTFKHIEVDIPSEKNVRTSIAKILGDLDDKIALNTQINQTLEAMAQALFKSWFVDFDPVKAKITAAQSLAPALSQREREVIVQRAAMAVISGKSDEELVQFEQENPDAFGQLAATADLFPEALVESELGLIPEGWEVKNLGAYLEIKRGGSPRPIKDFIVPNGYPWVKIADATADKSPFLFSTKEFIKEEGLRKTVYLKKDSLILSNSATPGLPKFLQLDACIHDGWLYFPKKKHFTDTYLYFLFLKIRAELVAQGNGSVFTNLKTDILRNQSVVVPSEMVMGTFTKNACSILDSMRTLCEETQSLAETRDTLLPKLLSGEIDLSSFGDREVGE